LQFATRNAPPNLPPRDHGSKPRLPGQKSNDYHEEASLAASAANKRRPNASGVKFTFIIYENQRRWVGLGWTTSLFAYERSNWTDEHLNPAPSKAEFELPDVEGGTARWRWVKGSKWLVEGAGIDDEGGTNATSEAKSGGHGWIYYDNKVCQDVASLQIATDQTSGKTAAEDKMAGASTRGGESGIAMLSLSR
jgi:hypothetical protein